MFYVGQCSILCSFLSVLSSNGLVYGEMAYNYSESQFFMELSICKPNRTNWKTFLGVVISKFC